MLCDLPFLTALQNRGMRVSAAGTGAISPFSSNGIQYPSISVGYKFGARIADRAAIGQLSQLVRRIRPERCSRPSTQNRTCLRLSRSAGAVPIVRTINGMGWVFSSEQLRKPLRSGRSIRGGRRLYRQLDRPERTDFSK